MSDISVPDDRDRWLPADSIDVFDDLDSLYQAATVAFCEAVQNAVRINGAFSVALSGGSTPKRLYELLSGEDLPWEKVHWFWGDERNVPHDHADSNTRMVREAILDSIPAPEANIHTVPVDVDDPADAALAYESMLRDFFRDQALPEWDLSLQGMGDDAHTASLFPETAAIDQTQRWFVENWVDKFDAYRYTLSAPAINSARQRWFLVAGSGKKAALDKVMSSDRQPRLYPSQLIRPTRLFVTADAVADR